MLRSLVLLISVVALSGCLATGGAVHYYKGKERPESGLVTIVIPEEVDVVAVNNRKRALPLVRDDFYTLKLLPGLNELVLEYDAVWDLDSDSHETIRSEVVLVSQVMQAGEVYSISVPRFQTLEEVRAFADDFKVEMVKKGSGEKVESKPARYDVVSSVQTHQLVSAVKAGVTGESQVMVHGLEDRAHQVPGQYSPLQNLRYWWKEASDQERELFEDWMATVD